MAVLLEVLQLGLVLEELPLDQEPSKTRDILGIAKEKKINKKLNTWAGMPSSSVLVRVAQAIQFEGIGRRWTSEYLRKNNGPTRLL
ncbi:hypothetical protein THAOC_24981 [Thalassiosira oceanica]|uniref:HTH CENPB-type domain-containing protein n=1 Tax=Thalassiosira oceanica TaxID=159749 RepID=K0S982_THAOC|nr:hypothetical protein THAOC_24981 [Thalassiosira oceanica]|eukprot:EJK55302.1 hypothetical protein THAOC_24981 [Thalassiosira oceanica]